MCAALIWQRTRACPCGTTGNPNPVTKTPSSQQHVTHLDRRGRLADDDRHDRRLAGERLEARLGDRLAEVVGVLAQLSSRAPDALEELHRRERARRHRRRQRVREQLRARALREHVAERRRTRDEAARRAAERLAERRRDDVHLAEHAECSAVPRPVSPSTPVACESSIDDDRVVLARDLRMSGSFAMLPSIEKMPSVQMMRRCAPFAPSSFARRSSMSECLYTAVVHFVIAFASRIESMIDAWLSASETTKSPSLDDRRGEPFVRVPRRDVADSDASVPTSARAPARARGGS